MRHSYSITDARFASEEACMEWLAAGCTRNQAIVLRRALDWYWSVRTEPGGYPDALLVAAQLKAMRADVPTLVGALLGSSVCAGRYPVDEVHEHFGQECASLVDEVRRINDLSLTPREQTTGRDQAEMLRRMVLSMVQDIRVVLVKLAFRTQRLYMLVKTEREERVPVANETLAIYAPLANRLGLGHLKWELEDVAFRIVEPQAYKRIAGALEENRQAREAYIKDFVSNLQQRLIDGELEAAEVFGRPKHIFSIWKKMRSKRIEFSDLFDVRAVRVLVENVQQCYGALGIVHGAWQPIVREFDDYIANPKPNGYRSLHTAVIGPRGRPVEVQIRTRGMNDDAENGVAAHWAYKEGSQADLSIQRSIDTLRQLLDDNDDDEQLLEGFSQQLDTQRVYVFTPQGEVIDLVAGSTPLDFAYHVHSEIGHRCRGAKVNGRIVPLTYTLRNGDQVEVLTMREPSPSRDWLNRSLGYLNSSRARSKVRAWFNVQDHALHVADGRTLLDRELKRLHAGSVSIERICQKLRLDKPVDLYAALGRNELSVAQVVSVVDQLLEPEIDLSQKPPTRVRPPRQSEAIRVRGVGNLLTSVATCCQPVPYDSIVGFITRGKGVSIHRAECTNILNLPAEQQERLIEVDWGDETDGRYRVEIRILAYDRTGLLRDVSTTLANLKINVIGVNTLSNADDQTADMRISCDVARLSELNSLMDRIRQLRNVQSVERVV